MILLFIIIDMYSARGYFQSFQISKHFPLRLKAGLVAVSPTNKNFNRMCVNTIDNEELQGD